MVSGQAIAGALQGFMQGYDYQQALDRRRAQEDSAAQRQSELARQHDVSFQQSQQDRSHMLERRPVLEQRADDTYGLQSEMARNQLDASEFEAKRRPIVAKQKDASFALDQKAARQRMGTEGQRQKLNAMKQQMAQWGIDEKRRELERQEIRDALQAGFGAYRMSGDPSAIEKAWNETAAQSGMAPIDNLTKNENGSFTIQMAGTEPMTIKDDKHLLGTIATVVSPNNFLEIYYQSMAAQQATDAARAKNPKNFQELIRTNDGQLAQVDLVTGQVSPVTNQQGGMVSGTLAGRDRGDTPAKIAADFYQEQLEGTFGDTEKAAAQTKAFMTTAYPTAQGWWTGGQQAHGQTAPVADQQPTGAAPSGIPAQAAMDLRKNPTPQMRAFFDAQFGAGSAAAVLGQ